MRQWLLAHGTYPAGLASGTSRYSPVNATQTYSGAANAWTPVPYAVTATKLAVSLLAAPGSGNTFTVQLWKNGASIGEVVLTGNETYKESTTPLSFVAGDRLNYRAVWSGSGTSPEITFRCALLIEGGGDTQGFLLGSTGGNLLSNTGVVYAHPTLTVSANAAESIRQYMVPADGQITGFSFYLSGTPGAGKSYTFRLRKNGADVGDPLTIADTATSGSVTFATPVPVTAFDLLSLSSTPTGTPTQLYGWYVIQYTTSEAFAAWYGDLGTGSVPSTTATNWTNLAYGAWTASPTILMFVPDTVLVGSFRVRSTSGPGSGSYELAIVSGSGGNDVVLPVTMSGGQTQASNLVFTTTQGDIGIRSVPSNSPSSLSKVWISCVLKVPVLLPVPDPVVEIDFGSGWENVTGRVLDLQARTGRDFAGGILGQASAGQMRLLLDNSDGRFQPSQVYAGLPIRWRDGRVAPDEQVVYARDSFDRPDSPSLGISDSGHAWQNLSSSTGDVPFTATARLADGKALGPEPPTTGASRAGAVVETGQADCIVSATVSDFGTDLSDAGIIARLTDALNFFYLRARHDTLVLYRVQNGTRTNLWEMFWAIRPEGLRDGDQIALGLKGQTIEIFLNGCKLAAVTDAFNQSATKHGLATTTLANMVPATVDDFRVISHVPAETGQLWSGSIVSVVPSVAPGPQKLVTIEAVGPLARVAALRVVDIPSRGISIAGGMLYNTQTGHVLGWLLNRAGLAEPGLVANGVLIAPFVLRHGPQDAMSVLLDLERTELGIVRERGDGRVEFLPRGYSGPVRAFVSDLPGSAISPETVEFDDALTGVVNEVEVAASAPAPGSVTTLWTLPSSQAGYTLSAANPKRDHTATNEGVVAFWRTYSYTASWTGGSANVTRGGGPYTSRWPLTVRYESSVHSPDYQVTGLSAQGALVTINEDRLLKRDPASVTKYGPRRLTVQTYLPDRDAMETLATELLNRFSQPRARVKRLSFMALKTTDHYRVAVEARVGDRVSVRLANAGVDGEYRIEAIVHRLSRGKTLHSVEWVLSPA